jgi:hypothetical protein
MAHGRKQNGNSYTLIPCLTCGNLAKAKGDKAICPVCNPGIKKVKNNKKSRNKKRVPNEAPLYFSLIRQESDSLDVWHL